MKQLHLSYRDANNFKCGWNVTVTDKVYENRPEPNEDGMTDITGLGLTVGDIPLIRQFGFDGDTDHPFVTIDAVEDEHAPAPSWNACSSMSRSRT